MIPIQKKVRTEFLSLLGSIRKVNGLPVDASVEEADDRGNGSVSPDGRLKIILGDGPLTDISHDKGQVPAGHDGFWKQIDVIMIAAASQTDTKSANDMLDELEAAVRFTIGRNQNYTLRGTCRNYKFEPVMPAEYGRGKLPCRILPVLFCFHTLRGNPYQQ